MYQSLDYMENFRDLESMYDNDNDSYEDFKMGSGSALGSRGNLMSNPGISKGHISKSTSPQIVSVTPPIPLNDSSPVVVNKPKPKPKIINKPKGKISKNNNTKDLNKLFADDSGGGKSIKKKIIKKNIDKVTKKNANDDDNVNITVDHNNTRRNNRIVNKNYIDNNYWDQYPYRYYNGYSVPYWYYLNYPMSYYPYYYNLYNYMYNQYEEKAEESNIDINKDIIDEYIKLKVEKILDEIISEENLGLSDKDKLEKFNSSIVLSENNDFSYTDSIIVAILFVIGILVIYCSLKNIEVI
jgi:hypothetical protein